MPHLESLSPAGLEQGPDVNQPLASGIREVGNTAIRGFVKDLVQQVGPPIFGSSVPEL